jgi:hypothetical protein
MGRMGSVTFGSWVCEECGCPNRISEEYCMSCGAYGDAESSGSSYSYVSPAQTEPIEGTQEPYAGLKNRSDLHADTWGSVLPLNRQEPHIEDSFKDVNSSSASDNTIRSPKNESEERNVKLETPSTLIEDAVSRVSIDNLEHTSGEVHKRHCFDGDDDTISVLSWAGSVASIFFSNSVASSATGLSAVGGYSSSDIATASRELISIFLENKAMLPLYEAALTSPAIGPERLQRNLRRLFKAYSEHLKDEATDQLEYLAAQLVAMKSRGLSESIIEKFQSSPVHLRANERGEYSESSDEESDTRPVNEEGLADLIAFRRFLVESEAFKTLQAQLQAFVLPTLPMPLDSGHSHDHKGYNIKHESKFRCAKPSNRARLKPRTWQCWQHDAAETAYAYLCNSEGLTKIAVLMYILVDLVFLTTDGSLNFMGLLEPPLHPTKIRLRWSCVRTSRILLHQSIFSLLINLIEMW